MTIDEAIAQARASDAKGDSLSRMSTAAYLLAEEVERLRKEKALLLAAKEVVIQSPPPHPVETAAYIRHLLETQQRLEWEIHDLQKKHYRRYVEERDENRELRKEIANLHAEREAAAGECLVDIPPVGSDAGKLLLANRMMMYEIERLKASVATMREELLKDAACWRNETGPHTPSARAERNEKWARECEEAARQADRIDQQQAAVALTDEELDRQAIIQQEAGG